MDKQHKDATRKKISRKEMMRYLTRFKLKKKQPRILPRTFANSQGLSIRRLQPTPSVEIKKPIINNNVRARLESNLQYLLQNQNKVIKRFRQPESYISLKVNKTKATVNKSNGKNRNTADEAKTGHSGGKCFGSRPDPLVKSNENDVIEIQSFKSISKSRHNSRNKANSFHFDDNSSFAFDTFENEVRAGDGSKVPSLSGVSSGFFKDSLNQNNADRKMDWSFDDPTLITEPPSVSTERRHIWPKAIDNRHKHSWSESFDFNGCSSLDFDTNENQIRAKSGGEKRTSGQTDWSKFDSQPDRSIIDSFDCFDPNQFDEQTTKKSTVRKTRVITSSLSRFGESPFMEQIVIQKVKRKF